MLTYQQNVLTIAADQQPKRADVKKMLVLYKQRDGYYELFTKKF